ncbi:hypothetical protein HHI36_015755, partial [Cryptolaemus montrouzieri]
YLPFILKENNGHLSIVYTKWSNARFYMHTFIGYSSPIASYWFLRNVVYFIRDHNADSSQVQFASSASVMFLYLMPKMIFRKNELTSILTLWKKLIDFNKHWEFNECTEMKKIVWKLRIKAVSLIVANTIYTIHGNSDFAQDVHGLLIYFYVTIVFIFHMYMINTINILVAYLIGNIRKTLKQMRLKSGNHLYIKELAVAYTDVIEIADTMTRASSCHLASVFIFTAIGAVIQLYSLYTFAERNSFHDVIFVAVTIFMTFFILINCIVHVAEACKEQVR